MTRLADLLPCSAGGLAGLSAHHTHSPASRRRYITP